MTRKKTRTWRRTKLRKDKVVEGGRGGIVAFMTTKPLPSLPWDQVEPWGTTAHDGYPNSADGAAQKCARVQ